MRLTFKWFQRLCLVQFLLMLTLTWVAGILFEKKGGVRGGGSNSHRRNWPLQKPWSS